MAFEVLSPGRQKVRSTKKIIAVGATVVAGVYADGIWGKRHWPSSPDRVVGVTPGAKELSLTWSGLGSLDGHKQAQAARAMLPGKPAHWEYSSDGTSLAKLVHLFDRQASEVETIHTYGHSMGGPLSFVVLSRVAQGRARRRDAMLEHGDARAQYIPELKLGRVVLNCSPFDSDDARLRNYAQLLRVVKWPVGPTGKFVFSFIRNMLEGKPMGDAWSRAKGDTLSGCSPQLPLSQMEMMSRIDLGSIKANIQPLIGPATEILYCRPEDPLLDPAVDTMQASRKYEELASQLGVPFLDIPIPEVGHAESDRTFAYLARVGGQVLTQLVDPALFRLASE